jgi:mercuric ion transport protein
MPIDAHLDKIGTSGSIVAALCCLGTPAVLSLVAAVGLGFLIDDAILVPLLAVFLLATLWGLVLGWRRHGRVAALALGGVASVLLSVSVFFLGSGPLAYVAITTLVAASVVNMTLSRPRRCPSPQRGKPDSP